MKQIEHTNKPQAEIYNPKHFKDLTIYSLKEACRFKLTATVAFEPDQFDEKSSTNIHIRVSPETDKLLTDIENSLKKQLIQVNQNTDESWISKQRQNNTKFPPTWKLKLSRKCKFYNMQNKPIKKPEHWDKLSTQIVVNIGGVYSNPEKTGMLFEITHLKFDPQSQIEECPFD